MTDYRYPNERIILAGTLALVLAVIAVTATATLCGSVVFVAAGLAFAYLSNFQRHDALVRQAEPVVPQTLPGLVALVELARRRLGVQPVRAFVAASRVLNAYTFGLSDPKVVVLYAGLFRALDEDEVLFIIGHELGHVRLGHTWLNSLVGGMAGIPSPLSAGVILQFAFRWWSRACEYSADRAGLLACRNLDKAISALMKIGGGGVVSPQVLARIQTQDDTFEGHLAEALSTHPMIVRRIEALRAWAGTEGYRRLRREIDRAGHA
jgi:Zn-dependent protease with chaperone function